MTKENSNPRSGEAPGRDNLTPLEKSLHTHFEEYMPELCQQDTSNDISVHGYVSFKKLPV